MEYNPARVPVSVNPNWTGVSYSNGNGADCIDKLIEFYRTGEPVKPHCKALSNAYQGTGRNDKDRLLQRLLMRLDLIGFPSVTEIIRYIGGPELKSDLIIARGYPPEDEGKKLVEKFSGDFYSFRQELMDIRGLFKPEKVDDEFIVASSVLVSGMKDQYAGMAQKRFLYRVLRGLIGMRLSQAEPPEFENLTEELKEELPESLHSKIEPIRRLGGWLEDKKKVGYI